MPRPKGSKNKKTEIVPSFSMEELEQKIAAAEKEIEDITAGLKTKKAELKELIKTKDAAEKAAAAAKAEEETAKIMEAIQKSGKSLDEILELLK